MPDVTPLGKLPTDRPSAGTGFAIQGENVCHFFDKGASGHFPVYMAVVEALLTGATSRC